MPRPTLQAAVEQFREFTGRCGGCDGATVSRGDLLCPACWRRIPRVTVDLYRLVYRLAQAQLAPPDAAKELARLVAREARDAVRGIAPRASAADAPVLAPAGAAQPVKPNRIPRTPRVPKLRPAPRRTQVFEAMPVSDRRAVTAIELAAKLKVDPSLVKAALADLHREGSVSGRVRKRAGVGGRPPVEYWKAA